MQTELEKGKCFLVHLLDVTTSSTTVYITDAYRNLSYGGNTYTALGYLLGFSDIEEFAEIQVSSVTVSLTGVDQTMISTFLNYQYLERPLLIYKGAVSNEGQLIADPVLSFSGRIKTATISENPDDGSSVFSVEAASRWTDFERRPGRHTNNHEQQHWFPNDRGMEYAHQTIERINWGYPGSDWD